MSIRLVTFGRPALQVEGVAKELQSEHLALLAYLLIETRAGRPHTREELRDLLWKKVDRKSTPSLTVVSKALSELRDAFGEEVGERILPPYERRIVLREELESDVGELLDAQKRADRRRDALTGYKGPFLEGLDLGPNYPEWQDWLEGQRKRFETLFLDQSREECEDLLAAREWRQLASVSQHALTQVPTWTAGRGYLSRAAEEIERSELMRREGHEAGSGPAEPEVGVVGPAVLPLPARPRSTFNRIAVAASLVAAAVVGLFLFTRDNTEGSGLSSPLSKAMPPLCKPGEARAHRFDQNFKPNVETVMQPGERFSTVWHLQNVGACTWDADYHAQKLRNTGAHPLTLNNLDQISLRRHVGPGDTISISAPMQAPWVEGSAGEDWVLQDDTGKPIPLKDGEPLRGRIRVLLADRVPICHRDSVRAEMVGTNYPDNAVLRPGQSFVYTWTVLNRTKGRGCVLDSRYRLRFRSAPNGRLSDPLVTEVPIIDERVIPSYGYAFELPMRAPRRKGDYVEEWYFTDESGVPIPLERGTTTAAAISVSADAVQAPRVKVCGPGEAKADFWNTERITDETLMPLGKRFRKAWTIPNTGDCMWPDGTHFHYSHSEGGPRLSTGPLEVPLAHPVPPNHTHTFSVPMVARGPLGEHKEHWALHDAEHRVIKMSATEAVWVEINVVQQ